MKIAIPLYDRFTALDAVGPYEVLQRLPGASVTWLAHEPGVVRTDTGMLGIEATAAFEDLPDPEIVLVPGGTGTNDFLEDERLVGWIRRAHETSEWTTSVCTGSLLLGAAGVLDGLEATTHWLDMDDLERYGAGRSAARGGAGQGDHSGGRVIGHRHGPGAGREDRRARGGEGDSARNRIRPPAAIRLRLRGEGSAGDGRADPKPGRRAVVRALRNRGGSTYVPASVHKAPNPLAEADGGPLHRAVRDAVHAGPRECHAVAPGV